jgi:hypothetical protein
VQRLCVGQPRVEGLDFTPFADDVVQHVELQLEVLVDLNGQGAKRPPLKSIAKGKGQIFLTFGAKPP